MIETIYLLAFAAAAAATVAGVKLYNRRQRQAPERRWEALADKITNDVDRILADPWTSDRDAGDPSTT